MTRGRRILTVLTTATLLTGPLAALPAIAHASAIKITKVYYDSPGKDTRSNTSLNAEWVRIKNTGNHRKNLKGWTLRDLDHHVYHFGTLKLRPGRSVTIHTGSGTDGHHQLYWGMRNYVWNNDGDTAKLRKASGKLVDRCHWSGGAPGYTSCG